MQKQTQIYKTIHTVASFVTFYISTRTEIISVKNYNLLTIYRLRYWKNVNTRKEIRNFIYTCKIHGFL